MRVVHIASEGDLAAASGVGTFVRNLDAALRARGIDSSIVSDVTNLPLGGANASPVDANFCSRPQQDQSSAVHLLSRPTFSSSPLLFHIHGLWLGIHRAAARIARAQGIPIVWSTHGMTAPWAMHHKWWKKLPVWWLCQRRDLRRAAAIHCTTELEEGWNRALGFTNTFIAPLGTTLPVDANFCSRPQKEQPSAVHLHLSPSPSSPRTLLYVGRIYPVKALDNLIRAFALAVKETTIHSPTPHSNWILRIVGPDQAGHLAELQSLCDQLGLPYTSPVDANAPTTSPVDANAPTESPVDADVPTASPVDADVPTASPVDANFCSRPQQDQPSTVHLHLSPSPSPAPLVEFPGPKYGADLDAEYENCTALALVSHTENFGATVVDALAHSKPVITSTNTPWKIVTGDASPVDADVPTASPVDANFCSRRCGYWVPNDPESLSRAISELFNLSTSQLHTLGANGRALVEERYTWPAVAAKLESLYRKLSKQS